MVRSGYSDLTIPLLVTPVACNDLTMRNTTILLRLPVVRVSAVAFAACAAAMGIAVGAAGAARGQDAASAHAARSTYLSEYASLRFAHENGSSISERGQGSGTFRAPIAAVLTIRPEHVSATFTIYPKGGSVTGRASARYIIRGSTGYYGGTLTIVKGTGIYRHASGSNIGISGTINRQTFALIVKAHGWIRY